MAGEQILLIEDDERIGSTLLRALEGTGYRAVWARTGEEGIALGRSAPRDLVLLDLGLGDLDGLDVCRRMHAHDPNVPVIMLTARDDELDVVVGLDAGAVDYVTKPFKLAELLARIRAQLRRPAARDLGRGPVGDLVVDTDARRVWIRDRQIDLRPKEFDLLVRLVSSAGHAVTRETLMADVWDEHWFGSTKTLDFHIAALRRKLDAPGADTRITTLRGVGYRYELS